MKDMKEMKDDEDLQCWLLLPSINCTLESEVLIITSYYEEH